MTIKKFVKAIGEEGVEGELIKIIFISLISSIVITAVLYFALFNSVEGFSSKYGLYLFLVILSVSVIIPSVYHVRAYKNFSCMPGMMVGMTLGMVSGFLLGFYVGATNGMFYGSVYGMAIGVAIGIWNGKCCGVMGVMEGIMAGFMGGLMGAMTAIMMYNDNLFYFSIIVFAVCAVILFGLSYMIYKETREVEREHKDSAVFIALLSALITGITALMMVLGPRSVWLQ